MSQNSTSYGLAAPPVGWGNTVAPYGVIPAKAGIHVSQKCRSFHIHTMGPRLRGDDAAANFPTAYELQPPNFRFNIILVRSAGHPGNAGRHYPASL